MKKIAIIGANDSITLLINKAKALGYETHVFAWKCGAPGEEAADYFYPISIDEKELIYQKCLQLQIDGICSITSDYASPTVNYVSRKLGLPCNSAETEILARDKYKMRCAFKEAGIYVPNFIEVKDSLSVSSLIGEFQYPLIVKPTDCWGSKAVTKVDNKIELVSAVDNAIHASLSGKAIVEEFIEGDEYSAECICYCGEYNILAFTKKYTTGAPNYIETGHFQSEVLSNEMRRKYSEVLFEALKALGVRNGAAHIEFKVMPNGNVGIIEIGARMGGGNIGTDLTPASTGLDYIKMVIDVALGMRPSFKVINEQSPVFVKFIMNKSDFEAYKDFEKLNSDMLIKAQMLDFDFDKTVTDGSMRHGYYIFKTNLS